MSVRCAVHLTVKIRMTGIIFIVKRRLPCSAHRAPLEVYQVSGGDSRSLVHPARGTC
jgi:hypothetical protein